MECAVCYKEKLESYQIGIKCKQCKKIMCFECCCNYTLVNNFETNSDETGYACVTKIPCPICRTNNTFDY